jgi:hypothetical protein
MFKLNPLNTKNDQKTIKESLARLKIKNPSTGKSAYDKISQLMTGLILHRPKDPFQYLDKFVNKQVSITFNKSENQLDDVKFAKIQNSLFKVFLLKILGLSKIKLTN